jgi:hypothetical protein
MGEDKIRKGREQNSQQGKGVEKRLAKVSWTWKKSGKELALFRATRSKQKILNTG